MVAAAGLLEKRAATSSSASASRLLIISNRLPITISRSEGDHEWKMSMSSGGLVSALSGLKKNTTFTWIGWPGRRPDVDENHNAVATRQG